jgi:hypothetical protein
LPSEISVKKQFNILTMRKHNFGAGPGVLPEVAIKKTQESL